MDKEFLLGYILGGNGGGGDSPVLIDKTITANGTYEASSDNADGYKKIIVNVPSSTINRYSVANTTAHASIPNVIAKEVTN